MAKRNFNLTSSCSNCGSGDCSGCTASCGGCSNSQCSGGCSGSCTGCRYTCTGTCTGGCQGTCTNGCGGSCKSKCNTGCTTTAMVDNYNIVNSMSINLSASEIEALRTLAYHEVYTRRGQSFNDVEAISSGALVEATWWNALRNNIAQCLTVTGGTATAGNLISATDQRDIIVNAVKTLYAQKIAVW